MPPLLSLVALAPGPVLDVDDLRGAIVGAVVTAPDGRPLYARNPDTRLMPASNEKLFTVAFALDTLGPAYRSETRFWRDEESVGIDSDGTLDLSYARLRAFMEKFGHRPRVTLSQAFSAGRPLGWQLGDAPNRYAPAIAAFSCERAGVELRADANGQPQVFPAPLGVAIAPRGVSVVSGPTIPIAKGLRFEPVSGAVTWPSDVTLAPGVVDTLSQPFPDLSAAALFATDGEEASVTLANPDPRLVRRRAPDATLLADPLRDVAGRCLKPSDNFLAEQLLMMAASRKLNGKPVWRPTYESAAREISAWGRGRVGLPDRSFDPADGSGLSRKNLVTARSVVRLLNWSRRQAWGGTFVASLADPTTGTLKGRLRGIDFRGKTGTLDGACSLSGFVKCKSGRQLAVSLLMNHYACPTARVRALQDEFVKRVAASY